MCEVRSRLPKVEIGFKRRSLVPVPFPARGPEQHNNATSKKGSVQSTVRSHLVDQLCRCNSCLLDGGPREEPPKDDIPIPPKCPLNLVHFHVVPVREATVAARLPHGEARRALVILRRA